MGILKKKKKKTLEELREDNRKLIAKNEMDKEYRKVSQENYKLRNKKSIAFFSGVTKVAGKAGRYAYKKATAKPKVIKKLSKNRKPIKIGDFL